MDIKINMDQDTFVQEKVHFVGVQSLTGTVDCNVEDNDQDKEEEMCFPILNDDCPSEEDPLEFKIKTEGFKEIIIPIATNDFPPEELKPIVKDEIKEEFVNEPREYSTDEVDSDDYLCVNCKIACRLKDVVPEKSLKLFCDDCYVILRKKAYEEWTEKLYSELESCSTCSSVIHNCLDLGKHDCTRENVFYCSGCHVIFDKKEDMSFHVKQCFKLQEQTVRESENFIDKTIVDGKHHCSVRNDVEENEATFERSKFYVNDHTKKNSALISCKSKNHATGGDELKFKCKHCNKLLNNLSQLICHEQTHSGEKLFVCELCKKSFSSLGNLKRHVQLHTGDKPFVCELCKKSFSSLSYLKLHVRLHAGEKLFVCELCKKSFSSLSYLKLHVRLHTGEKSFVCELCKKSFSSLSYLKLHVQLHTGEKPFVCELCKKSFTALSSLKCHVRLHAGEKLFVCELCKKSFTTHVYLKCHVRLHTGEKPFVCKQCKKSFTTHVYLKRHVRLHTGEKPFVCKQCKKSFTTHDYLKRHVRLHTGEKPFVCELCKKSFTTHVYLKCHVRLHTGEKPFVCKLCKKSFTTLRSLKRHVRRLHTGEKPFV